MTSQNREWNPIIVRESRARWRGWQAFALVFGFVALLAIALFWRYASAYGDTQSQANPLQRVELLGAQLFQTLIWLQSFAWALIAPAITATTIAAERESGMLEATQLSPLSPRKIVAGKLVSALSLIALLLLVSIPITGTCLLLGGVSPEEFGAAILLHCATAWFGACLGLACSAFARRAGAALRSAYMLAIGWMIASGISIIQSAFPGMGLGAPAQFVLSLVGWSNPLIATSAITDVASARTTFSLFSGGIFADSPWLFSVAFQMIMGALLLCAATFVLRRPLAEQYWMRSKSEQQSFEAGSTPSSPSSVNPPTRSLRRQTSDWISIPIFSALRFANPVLQRETRSKFRMRQPPVWVLVFEGILALGVAYYYLKTLNEALFVPSQRELIWWIINAVGLLVVALAAAVSGAGAFTRERESQTWEALRLSLLQPVEILRAKLGATSIGILVFSLPFWPLLLPCIRLDMDYKSSLDGINVLQAILCAGVVAATAICYTLWGMAWSWRTRKTAAAVGWSLGTLFFALVFVPMFIIAGLLQGNSQDEALWIFHPFVMMAFTTEERNVGVVLAAIVFLLVASAALWAWLKRELQRAR